MPRIIGPRKHRIGETVKHIRLDGGPLIARICRERDLAGDFNATATVKRLLEQGLVRAEVERERTGSALAGAMRPQTHQQAKSRPEPRQEPERLPEAQPEPAAMPEPPRVQPSPEPRHEPKEEAYR